MTTTKLHISKTVKIHIVCCVLYFFLAYFTDKILEPGINFITEVILFLNYNVFLFYSFLFFLNKFSSKSLRKLVISILILLSIIIFFFGLKYLIRFYVLPKLGVTWSVNLSMKAFITGGLVWIIDYFLLALGYFYFTQSLKKERQLRRLQEENQLKINENIALKERELEKEKERFTLEQAYLRSQINPHFLFNMLNFFYAKSFENSPELADAILTLSQMMHYSLGKNENHQGLALLSDEIEHINNMIKLQQIRFSNRLQIRFDIDGNMAGKRIAPMVLVTLVENAFKHGDLLDAKNPVIISLRTDSDKNWLYFETHNKKKKGPKVLSPGIGIKNTKKRLQQLYKENYTLCVVDSEEFFTAILELPFLTDAQIMENMPILQNAL